MPSNRFDVQIAHRIKEIKPETWDHLAGKQAFASYRWYCFGELALKADLPVYIILSWQGEPVARATFWLKRQEQLPISSKIIRRFIEMVLRRWPLLVCRAPLADVSGLILPDPPLQHEALQTITQVAQAEARKYGVSFLFFDYLSQPETRWAGWPDTFAPTMIADPGTRLVISWPDFESYLKHLSKSAQSDYRRHRNRAVDLGLVLREHSTATRLAEALTLIQNVEQHHQGAAKPWAESILANLTQADAVWLTAELEERLVGCGLLLRDGDTAFLTLLGRDYNVGYAYFQLVYTGIKRAIAQEVKVLLAGSGAYSFKERLGFQVAENNYVTYTTHHWLFRWLGRRLKNW